MTIHAVIIVNNNGKPRLSKFFEPYPPTHIRTALIAQIFALMSSRTDDLCNFVHLPTPRDNSLGPLSSTSLRVVYRHYATLYFAFLVDEAESELGILDLIQVFVESLDRCFENVCELDLIFHFDEHLSKVHLLLSCIIVSGMVLDTSIDSISSNFKLAIKQRNQSINSNSILPDTSAAHASLPWQKLSGLGSGLGKYLGRNSNTSYPSF